MDSAANGIEIDFVQATRDRAGHSASHLAPVDLDHWGELSASAAQEDLVGRVQLGPVDRALDERDAEVDGDIQQVAPGDSLEDVVGDRWRDQGSINHQEVLVVDGTLIT